jgi:hypothetical protein
MALYQHEEDARLTVDFGGGRSLTLKMRGTDLDIETTRRLGTQAKKSELVEKRARRLESRAEEDMKAEEFTGVLDEVEKLQNGSTQVSMMVDYVYASVAGWVDYFATREAEAKGEVVPYTKENIGKMGVGALGKIVVALNGFFKFEVEQDPKAQTSLPPPSPSAETESLTPQST